MEILVLDLHIREDLKNSKISDALNKYADTFTLRLFSSDFSYGDLASYDAIVLTGSNSINAYSSPKVRELKHHLRRLSSDGGNMLGICGGNQVLASAFDYRRYKLREPETGWHSIHITERGKQDPLLKGLGDGFMAFEHHILAVRCDDKDKVLAENEYCSQAILYQPNVRGIQFHPEVIPESFTIAKEYVEWRIFRNFVNIARAT